MTNASKKMLEVMMAEAKVGWVAEMYHAVTGMHLGSVKMNAKGTLIINYVWGKE